MATEDIRAAYHQAKWTLALRGLIGIALGIIIFARPLASVAALALVIALWAIMDGIARIVQAFEVRSVANHWWLFLVSGLVSLGFGVAALYYHPTLSLTFAVLWAAWWLMIGGVLAGWIAIQEKNAHFPWGWTLTLGIIAIIAGILELAYPGVTLVVLMGLLAAYGLIGGVVMLIGAGKLQAFEHKLDATMQGVMQTHGRT